MNIQKIRYNSLSYKILLPSLYIKPIMKNNDAITVMDAPVGIDRMNEKKYPKTADNIPIMTENINTLLSFSVKNSEVSGGESNKTKYWQSS